MKSKHRLVNRIYLCLVLAIAICSLAIARPSLAQADFSLKSDLISLKSRIGRLEQEVTRLRSDLRSPNRSNSNRDKQPPPSRSDYIRGNPPIVNGQAIGDSDPLYERLATLLIELKEDVKNIDRRLIDLEDKASQMDN